MGQRASAGPGCARGAAAPSVRVVTCHACEAIGSRPPASSTQAPTTAGQRLAAGAGPVNKVAFSSGLGVALDCGRAVHMRREVHRIVGAC
jgi:hypothetical protein